MSGLILSLGLGVGFTPPLQQEEEAMYTNEAVAIIQLQKSITNNFALQLLHVSRPTKLDQGGGLNIIGLKFDLK